jgi:uncharacterized protein
MIAGDQGALYVGRVLHARLNPFRHRFQYRVFSLWLDIDQIATTAAELRLFAYNRFALLTFFDRDHGPCDGSPLRPWVEQVLSSVGIAPPSGAIRLLCFPRVLGYVFNPLSIYFCYDRRERLRATVYEVRNTFGELHVYVADAIADATGAIAQSAAKSFYVSPLMQMDARYDFRLKSPGERLTFSIRESGPDGPLLLAKHQADRVALSDWQLAKAFLTHPLLTIKVVGAIHFQALRLFLKGARYHRHRPHSGPQIDRADRPEPVQRREAA